MLPETHTNCFRRRRRHTASFTFQELKSDSNFALSLRIYPFGLYYIRAATGSNQNQRIAGDSTKRPGGCLLFAVSSKPVVCALEEEPFHTVVTTQDRFACVGVCINCRNLETAWLIFFNHVWSYEIPSVFLPRGFWITADLCNLPPDIFLKHGVRDRRCDRLGPFHVGH